MPRRKENLRAIETRDELVKAIASQNDPQRLRAALHDAAGWLFALEDSRCMATRYMAIRAVLSAYDVLTREEEEQEPPKRSVNRQGYHK